MFWNIKQAKLETGIFFKPGWTTVKVYLNQYYCNCGWGHASSGTVCYWSMEK